MKGLLQWFKASSKMKRWMLLILVGIVLTCYGIAEVLVLKEMSFDKVGKIIVTFIIGFVAIILGLVFLNKRTLEVLVESTDDRMENKKNVNEIPPSIKSKLNLIFADKVEEVLQNAIYEKYIGRELTKEEQELISLVDDAMLYNEFIHYMNEKLPTKDTNLVSKPKFEFVEFLKIENKYKELFNTLLNKCIEENTAKSYL